MDDTPPVICHIETHLGLFDPKAGHWVWDHASGAVLQVTTPATEFIWLVPISSMEAEEVRAGRGEELLDGWERDEVDLLDWGRRPMEANRGP